MSAGEELRQRIADAIDRLYDAGAIYAIEDSERDALAAELLPMVAAERADAVREEARALRRTPFDSRDYPAALTGARIIEDRLRVRAAVATSEVPDGE